MSESKSPPMMTPAEFAGRLGPRFSVDRVRALIAAGRLRALNVSPTPAHPRYMIREADAEAFLEAAATSATERRQRTTRARIADAEAMDFSQQLLSRRRSRRGVAHAVSGSQSS